MLIACFISYLLFLSLIKGSNSFEEVDNLLKGKASGDSLEEIDSYARELDEGKFMDFGGYVRYNGYAYARVYLCVRFPRNSFESVIERIESGLIPNVKIVLRFVLDCGEVREYSTEYMLDHINETKNTFCSLSKDSVHSGYCAGMAILGGSLKGHNLYVQVSGFDGKKNTDKVFWERRFFKNG